MLIYFDADVWSYINLAMAVTDNDLILHAYEVIAVEYYNAY